MKNKTQLIDVNILSSYLGRWMTLFSILIVISLTLSALYGNRRGQHNIIQVRVPSDMAAEDFEPFRALLGRETRRTVVVFNGGDQANDPCDIYLMRTADFLRKQEQLDLAALYEVLDTDRHNDQAVVFARSGEAIELNSLGWEDVAFSSPMSINGYWVQAGILSQLGMDAQPAAGQFVGGGADATRVVFAVLFGEYRLGACRLSTIAEMRRRRVLRTGELSIVEKADALPEMIVAAGRADADYYRRKLAGVQARFDDANSGGNSDETVRLLRSFGFKGLAPVTPARLEQARRLARVYGGLEGSAAP